jgi:serine/threonine protein kinase
MATSDLGACEWFVWDLRRSNLIDRGQLDQEVGDFLKKNPRAEPPALAEYLVQRGILSKFQAQRILEGKTQGLVLGPYNLIDSIGTGSMGQVYKAISKSDNKYYAVKVLPRRSMWNVRLARRQVRAFSQFSHPAVVPFTDVGTSGGMHYLVWTLVEGEPLDHLVQRQGPLPPALVSKIGLEIAQGLNICHQNGLFHGLLKPSNVMIGPDGSARILDFGIGSLLVENEGESLVDTMSTANTLTSGLDCTSPESIMEPTNRTPAGDQYSLGCVLYYCLTGRYPFPEGSAVEKMMAHQSKQPPPITDFNPDTPPELVEIINRLMQKKPEARYASTDEIIEALEPLVPGAATGPAALPPTPMPGRPETPRLQRSSAGTSPFGGASPRPPAAAPRPPVEPVQPPGPTPTPPTRSRMQPEALPTPAYQPPAPAYQPPPAAPAYQPPAPAYQPPTAAPAYDEPAVAEPTWATRATAPQPEAAQAANPLVTMLLGILIGGAAFAITYFFFLKPAS